METENNRVKNANVTFNTPWFYATVISHLPTVIFQRTHSENK